MMLSPSLLDRTLDDVVFARSKKGGIHPDFTGDTYLKILDAAKKAAPDIHVHAFSPLEVHQVWMVWKVWMAGGAPGVEDWLLVGRGQNSFLCLTK